MGSSMASLPRQVHSRAPAVQQRHRGANRGCALRCPRLRAGTRGTAARRASRAVCLALPEVLAPLQETPTPETLAVEAGLAAAAAAVLVVLEGKPRGGKASDLVEVRESSVHGLGLYAAAPIPEGTVIGKYPGVKRSAQEMATKATYAPGSKDYCWLTGNGDYLDPTDQFGNVSEFPGPGSIWPFPTDTSLTRANEPPIGRATVNLVTEDAPGKNDILYVAMRNINQGEELFVDYGTSYDRSRYGPPS